jgi:uncharacterized protein (DUF302 family)
MHVYRKIFVIIILGLFLLFQTYTHASGQNDYYEKTTDKSLQDILEDIEFATTEHNLRIVNHLHIGQAIRLRGNENFPDYEVILYCNLTMAQKMLEFDPELINTCPGRITVRSMANSYIISASLWSEQNTDNRINVLMHDLNNQLRKIVDYAALEWSKPHEN